MAFTLTSSRGSPRPPFFFFFFFFFSLTPPQARQTLSEVRDTSFNFVGRLAHAPFFPFFFFFFPSPPRSTTLLPILCMTCGNKAILERPWKARLPPFFFSLFSFFPSFLGRAAPVPCRKRFFPPHVPNDQVENTGDRAHLRPR